MIKLGTAILASALGVSAFAQSGTALYMPTRNLQDQALSLKGWGSGTISQTDEVAVEGVYSLRVSTRNFFQGGFMAFGSPKDLSGSFGDKDNLLQVTYRLADGSVQLGGSGGGGGRTGGGMGTPGADSGELPSGGGGRQGGRPGGQPGHPPGGQTATTDAQLQTLRLIITTTDGKKSEAYINLRPGGGDWKKVSIPLQAINGFDKTNKTVKEIGFSGDATATFYVGELKIVNDTTPITGDVNRDSYNLALNDTAELRATGYGGSSVLRYTWDFDEADGIQEDAEGPVITRKFRKPGKYVVTVTIADKYGLKKPLMRKINITVNP